MSNDLPFVAEYAKSNRSSCKGCKSTIVKDSLRVGKMIQSPHFDGRIPLWFHFACFARNGKVKTTGDIGGFDNLRWDDQEKLRKLVEANAAGEKEELPTETGLCVQYCPKSGKCSGCMDKLRKNDLRIVKTDNGKSLSFHLGCFVTRQSHAGEAISVDLAKLNGYNELTEEDKALVSEKLATKKRARQDEDGATGSREEKRKKKKLKEPNSSSTVTTTSSSSSANAGSKPSSDQLDEKEMKLLKKQTDAIWKVKDSLQNNLTKSEMATLLEFNSQTVPKGESKILDRLADCMLFGPLKPCKACSGGQLVFCAEKNAYICTGNVSGWTRCQFSTQDPARGQLKIAPSLEENEYLSHFQFKSGMKRVFPSHRPEPSKAAPVNDYLSGLKLLLCESLNNADGAEKLEKCGGQAMKRFSTKLFGLICPEADFATATSSALKQAEKAGMPVFSEKILDLTNVTDLANACSELIVCKWFTGDLRERISKLGNTSKAMEQKACSAVSNESEKVIVKGGAAVCPDSGLVDEAHVYSDKNKVVYNAVLGAVDIQTGKNSFYKMQVLEHDHSAKYWVFRSWGRVGTTIGGNKLESFALASEATEEFRRLYLEKTGNDWSRRDRFEKMPGLFYPLAIDYEAGEAQQKSDIVPGSKSKLAEPVKQLILLIFDIDLMKRTMLEFSIDLKKMPLGKLSRHQIEDAFKILSELQELFDQRDKPNNATKVLDCSNRFYTLIPHDFGLLAPPLLDNVDLVKKKVEMLDSLLEIEIAYSMLKQSTDDEADVDPVDVQYEKLKADIDVLDKDSEEFKNIVAYVQNTHAATHNTYSLQVEDVFAVNRQGEEQRFRPFRKLPNRMLLWHGSRLSNAAGIISQGLRIAPPEAPSTGYMFGKGIYFADMASKSANYCCATSQSPTALMFLCDVALGNTWELTAAKYVTKLPKDKHSVKGLGKTVPDPTSYKTDKDGVVIPMSKGIDAGVASTLLYNEYIIYDPAQVRMKYIVKVKFDYKF